jgi:zinc transport system ATP-binding protein
MQFAEKNNLLELKNISLTIDGNKILENISLCLEKGKIKTLIGINGGGKTTLARIIIGAINASTGEIKKQKNIKIGHMPQKIQVDKTIPMTVIDFIKLVNNNNLDENFYSWCHRLKIENILNNQIHEISGGQLQKILFLQAVCGNNDLLILDEPTQFMDISAINEFYKILEEIRVAKNCGILLISHDLHLVMQKTDIVYCVNRHICCHGTPEDINQHPEYLSLLDKKISSIKNNKTTEIGFYTHHHDHDHKND